MSARTGLCIRCGVWPVPANEELCEECAEDAVCSSCGLSIDYPGKDRCRRCRDREAEERNAAQEEERRLRTDMIVDEHAMYDARECRSCGNELRLGEDVRCGSCQDRYLKSLNPADDHDDVAARPRDEEDGD